jgi:hypothetical protein
MVVSNCGFDLCFHLFICCLAIWVSVENVYVLAHFLKLEFFCCY